MDNIKSVIIALLLICSIGFVDTGYFSKKFQEHRLVELYKNKPKMIGFGLEQSGNYVRVQDVLKNTPADRAGILKEDVIVSLNYKKIKSAAKFVEILNHSQNNEKLILGILRNGENKIIYIVLNPYIFSGVRH